MCVYLFRRTKSTSKLAEWVTAEKRGIYQKKNEEQEMWNNNKTEILQVAANAKKKSEAERKKKKIGKSEVQSVVQ